MKRTPGEVSAIAPRPDILFEPVRLTTRLTVPNRIVMAPMTRRLSPKGVPGPDVAAYYRRRAEGGVGLIVTEGTWVPHFAASNDDSVPRFYGEDALAGWKTVVEEVHLGGAKIVPQLWHVGQTYLAHQSALYALPKACESRLVGPSGMVGTLGVFPTLRGVPASTVDISAIVDAFAAAARSAFELGFDGVELHGAHGYVFDQFQWATTNLRSDAYGGDGNARTRFGSEVVSAIRLATARDFPIIMRLSQWKIQDYLARIADTPQDLAKILEPLVDAGVDAFHCSQRRFWETEFGTDLNLAGWAKKITGLPAISVGSVGMAVDFFSTLGRTTSEPAGIEMLIDCFERGDFDMIAIGRALLSNPDWPLKIRRGDASDILAYDPTVLDGLL